MKKRSWVLLTGVLITALIIGYAHSSQDSGTESEADSGKVKNVIILIGDGMGPQAVGFLNSYAKYAPNSIYKDTERVTALETVIEKGVLGYAYHEAANVLVTDSAASATQIASGKMALSETIGIDQYGNRTETILEKAKKMGKSAGLVSDTRITHATPAAFAAHQAHRTKENEIAVDLLNNQVDVMLSGGLRYWIPKEANDKSSEIHKKLKNMTGGKIKIKSKRKDSRNLLEEAKAKDYALAFTKKQLKQSESNKLLGLFSYSVMPYRIDLDTGDPARSVPTLKEMTEKALDTLSKNEKGFFLMVESGLIDWAGHDNDAGTLLHEMLRFDETLAYIFDWVKERNDTLLIVSADHETGSFGFSYSRRNIPEPKEFPGTEFKGEKFAPKFNFGTYDILDRIYKQKISYQAMMDEFDGLSKDQKTPGAMMKIVNNNSEFLITEEEAAVVLEREKNDYYIKGHTYLGSETFPKINDFKEFYVYSEEVRKDILARVVAKQQNIVWSTGTHTSAPVPLITYGPEKITSQFSKMLHTTEWAQYAIDALTGK
ncbi:MAG: alkaline phosphatase [Desulfobacterales bacterium]|nr:alkaline phosphatase [Desulfobacterales bacterium]